MVLEKLFENMGVTEHFDKVVVTAVVMDTLKANSCGVTSDNEEAVKETLINGVCSRYELEVLMLGAYWASDLAGLLEEHLKLDGQLYRDYIWKYISENEVYPGVRMGVC